MGGAHRVVFDHKGRAHDAAWIDLYGAAAWAFAAAEVTEVRLGADCTAAGWIKPLSMIGNILVLIQYATH